MHNVKATAHFLTSFHKMEGKSKPQHVVFAMLAPHGKVQHVRMYVCIRTYICTQMELQIGRKLVEDMQKYVNLKLRIIPAQFSAWWWIRCNNVDSVQV